MITAIYLVIHLLIDVKTIKHSIQTIITGKTKSVIFIYNDYGLLTKLSVPDKLAVDIILIFNNNNNNNNNRNIIIIET